MLQRPQSTAIRHNRSEKKKLFMYSYDAFMTLNEFESVSTTLKKRGKILLHVYIEFDGEASLGK